VSVRIILNTRTSADYDSPWWIRCKDQNWIIDCTELRVNNRLHLMPLIQLYWVLGNIGWERGCSVTMSVVASGKLSLIVDTIRFHETLEMSQRLVNFVTNFFHKSEVLSLRDVHSLKSNLRILGSDPTTKLTLEILC
jgi:hypothetical protein